LAASRHPRRGGDSDHRAHFEGCQRVGRPQPPSKPETTLRKAKATGFGFVKTQRRSKDQRVAKNPRQAGTRGAGATVVYARSRKVLAASTSARKSGAPAPSGSSPGRQRTPRQNG